PRQPAPDRHLRRARRELDVVLRRRSLPVGVTGMATVPGPAQQRTAEMFPTLDDAQIDRMRAVGRERAFHTGEILFEQGEPSTKCFVVLEAPLEVVQPFGPGEQLITVHEPGEFTGEMTVLAGSTSLVRGRARTAGRVIEIDRSALRTVIATDSDLSETLMRA